jgi:hypothetical protein
MLKSGYRAGHPTSPLRPDVREKFLPKHSLNFNSWDTIIFKGWKFKSKCRILLKLRSDIPKATACLQAEHLGDCWIDALTSCTFSGVLMDLHWPCVRLLRVLPDSSNCLTQERIVPIRNSTVARNVEPSPKSSLRHDYWSVVFKIHAHGKATMCSSPNHVGYWNGVTYRAEGDHVHQPTPTTSWVFTPPNRLICSAAPCTTINKYF